MLKSTKYVNVPERADEIQLKLICIIVPAIFIFTFFVIFAIKANG